MEIYAYDKNFSLRGIVDNAISVIWSERYTQNGDFEIYATATQEAFELLKEGYYLKRKDTDYGMIVERIQAVTDIEEGNKIIVTGKSFESLVGRRIVWEQTNLEGTAEDAIRKLMDENLISPKKPERKIDNFILGDKKGFADRISLQVTGENLQETIKKICCMFGYGYRVALKDKKFIFQLYKGEDRSWGQSKNSKITFSRDFDNLINSNYEVDYSEYKNVCLVAGEGEGKDRRTKEVGKAFGIERREIFSDSRNTSSNNGEISDDEYYATLENDGIQVLKETQRKESFDGGVDYLRPYEYKKDYYLGDIVQVINEYGVAASPRITEVIESEDNEGYSVIPTFNFEGGEE